MIWLRLLWWIFWRTVVSSTLFAVLLGAIVAGRDGGELGALVGIGLGLVLGSLNAPIVASMTHLYLHRPQDYTPNRIWSARIVVMVIDCPLVLYLSLAFMHFGILSYLPPILTIIALYYLSVYYVKFVAAQRVKLTAHKPKPTMPL
jgi:hypothetical protein